MRDTYSEKRIRLSASELQFLVSSIEKKYHEIWKTIFGEELIPPSYKSNRQVFCGTKNTSFSNGDVKPSAFHFILKNEKVREAINYMLQNSIIRNEPRTSEFYKLFSKLGEGANIGRPYNYLYLLFIGCKNEEEFRKQFENYQRLNKSLVRQYYLCGLRIVQEKVVVHQIDVDMTTSKNVMNATMISSDSKEEHKEGTITYKPPFLEMRFDRTEKGIWMPFTAYFQSFLPFEDIVYLVGTLSGVGFDSKTVISSVAVLVLKTEYDDNELLKRQIHRYLFTGTYGISIPQDEVNQRINRKKLLLDSDEAQLSTFYGEHELVNLGRNSDRLVVFFELLIDKHFYTKKGFSCKKKMYKKGK